MIERKNPFFMSHEPTESGLTSRDVWMETVIVA